MIVINSVVIAGRTAYGVEATVSGETVIVALPLLYKISGGKFSFDRGSLVFGGCLGGHELDWAWKRTLTSWG
jgi:hypothetical protein